MKTKHNLFIQDHSDLLPHYPMTKLLLKRREDQQKKETLENQKIQMSKLLVLQMNKKYNQAIEEKFKAEEERVKAKLKQSDFKQLVLTKDKLRKDIRDVDLKI